MGLFGKKKEEAPAAVTKKEPEGTVIGEGITFVGTFTTDELIDIRGKVEGEIISPTVVHVAKTGKHEGTMDVEFLTVDGTIDSDIHCRNTITLNDDCDAYGTLTTPNLDALHGSNFHGELILEKKLGEKPEEVPAEEPADEGEFEAPMPVVEADEFVELLDDSEDAPIAEGDVFEAEKA